jgi:hypothetical protein
MEVHVWTEYANYLLGKFVLGILGGEDGAPVGSADWEVILTYEQEIRREMVVRMQAGTPLGTALRGGLVGSDCEGPLPGFCASEAHAQGKARR